MNYDVVIDPNYKGAKLTQDVEGFIDEQIWNRLQDGNYSENDVEEILELVLLSQNYELVQRQWTTRKVRVDLAFRKGGEFLVIELKRDVAKLDSLEQLRRYISSVRREHKIKHIKGVIICHESDPRLTEATKNEDDIVVREFRFGMNFGLGLNSM